MAPKFGAGSKARKLPLTSTSYLISSAGLVWNKMAEEQVHAHSQLGIAEIEVLKGNLFEQVNCNYLALFLGFTTVHILIANQYAK